MVTKNFVGGPLYFKNGLFSQFFWIIGVSRFSLESVLSHSTEKIRRGTHLGFRKLLVSENFTGKRRRGRKGVSRFSVRNFCLTRPKISDWNPLVFEKTLVSKNFTHKRGKGITVLRRIFFVSQDRTIS